MNMRTNGRFHLRKMVKETVSSCMQLDREREREIDLFSNFSDEHDITVYNEYQYKFGLSISFISNKLFVLN